MTPLVGLYVEGIELDRIGVTLEPATVPPTLAWCWHQLETLTPDPSRVELVVTGDFPGSVARRAGPQDAANGHVVEHGAGVTAGKTLRMPDRRAVVFLHGYCFRVDLDRDQTEVNEKIVKRVLMHEIQHVAMHQNNQVHQPDPGASFRSLNLVGGAAAIIEEYRAEVSVNAELREGEPQWEPSTVVDDLAKNLNVAVAAYQMHRSVGRMVFEVTTAVLVFWRSLAYISARHEVTGFGLDHLADLHAHPVWREVIAARWDDFRDLLRHAAPGDVVMSTATLNSLAEALSVIIGDSMTALGFHWRDGVFTIHPRFTATVAYAAALEEARANAASVTERLRARWRKRPALGGSLPR